MKVIFSFSSYKLSALNTVRYLIDLRSDNMYSLSITQRLHCRKNTQNTLESWRIQICTHSDLHSWKYHKSAQKIHKRNYALTRRLKRRQHRTDFNVHHNGLVNRVFMCRTKRQLVNSQKLVNEIVTEPSLNISGFVNIETDLQVLTTPRMSLGRITA